MKKQFLVLLTVLLSFCFAACTAEELPAPQTEEPGQESQSVAAAPAESKPIIVASAFHEYDWLMQVLGEKEADFEVELLMENGVDMHSFEPSMEEIVLISKADILIYNGGLSQDWLGDLLAQSATDEMIIINMMERLGDSVQHEVLVEGMQADAHAHAHDEDAHNHDEGTHAHNEDAHNHDDDSHDHADDAHADEHIWLSLNNAIAACGIIADELAVLDPENAILYQENAQAYQAALQALDQSFEAAIAAAPRDTLVFADRFPFLYLMGDYQINYYAAFQGCSAETEATFETIAFLSDKVNQLDLNQLLILDNGLHELAQAVIDNSNNEGVAVAELHAMQSITAAEVADGASYYSIMESNLQILTAALAE